MYAKASLDGCGILLTIEKQATVWSKKEQLLSLHSSIKETFRLGKKWRFCWIKTNPVLVYRLVDLKEQVVILIDRGFWYSIKRIYLNSSGPSQNSQSCVWKQLFLSSENDIFEELTSKKCSHQHSGRKRCSHPDQSLSHKINSNALIPTETHVDKVTDSPPSSGLSSPGHERSLVWVQELRDWWRENSFILSSPLSPLAFIDCLKKKMSFTPSSYSVHGVI